jgi:hypothetical protein
MKDRKIKREIKYPVLHFYFLTSYKEIGGEKKNSLSQLDKKEVVFLWSINFIT